MPIFPLHLLDLDCCRPGCPPPCGCVRPPSHGASSMPFVPVPAVPPGTAYGGRYNATGAALALPAGEAALPLPTTIDFINVRYRDDAIELVRDGIYEVTVALRGVATVNGTAATGQYGLAARADGAAIPELTFWGSSASGDLVIMGTAPVRLRRGALIDLAVTVPYASILTLRAGNAASLIVRRIAAA